MTQYPKLDLIIIDCPDVVQLATFYRDVLGWKVERELSDEFTIIAPPSGGISPENPDGHPALAFQRVDDYQPPTWPTGTHPQQFHLDLSVPDIAAAEPRIIDLGATVHDHQPSGNGSFRVYLDPAGHPFCLILAG